MPAELLNFSTPTFANAEPEDDTRRTAALGNMTCSPLRFCRSRLFVLLCVRDEPTCLGSGIRNELRCVVSGSSHDRRHVNESLISLRFFLTTHKAIFCCQLDPHLNSFEYIPTGLGCMLLAHRSHRPWVVYVSVALCAAPFAPPLCQRT